jgi:hypothetical protein
LKNLNQELLEQIRKLKEEEVEKNNVNKVDRATNEELARLKIHNQNLLTQNKKLKNDKKSLENKLELLIDKEKIEVFKGANPSCGKGNNYRSNPCHIPRSCKVS